MGNPRCKWVRDRLPLLAGDELVGFDRRKVERHLIGCPKCRQHRIALADALDILHAASAHSPSQPDAPSLWPALARQISESRRPAPAPALSAAWPRWGGWSPVLGLSGLGLLAAIGMAVVLVRPTPPAPADSIAQFRPTAAPAIGPVPAPRPARPLDVPTSAPSRDLPRSSADTPVVENTSMTRLDYDLERGTPMPADPPRDARQPTY